MYVERYPCNKPCVACCSVWHRTTTVHLVILMWITSCKISWIFAVNCMISSTVMWACCNVQHFITNHTESQISQEWRAALPSPFTGGWLHMCSFIKMHYSLTSCQLYILVPVLFSCARFGTKSYIYELTLVISIMCNCLAHSHQLKVNVWGGKWWQCTWTNSATKRTSLAIAPVLTTVTPQLLHLPDWCCFMQSYQTTCQSYPLIQLHTIHTQPHTSHTKQHTSHRFNPNYMPVTLNHTPNNTNHTVTPTTPNCMSYN